MLGKAVKLRHCPATVSAPVFLAVICPSEGTEQGFSPGVSASETPIKPLKSNRFDSTLGRQLNRAQVRRPVLGVPNRFHVPRGTKELLCRFPFSRAQLTASPHHESCPEPSLDSCLEFRLAFTHASCLARSPLDSSRSALQSAPPHPFAASSPMLPAPG